MQAEAGGYGESVSVLVVDDEEAIRNLMRAAMTGTEFKPIEAESGTIALSHLASKRPHIVLLDLGLPDLNGLEFISQARGWTDIPILVVSGTGDEDRKVQCLEAGADDYITKPFGVGELLARMRVAVRHYRARSSGEAAEPTLVAGDVEIDLARRTVTKNGNQVHLSPIEFNLLTFLARHAGRVVTHRQILAEIWGDEYSEESQYLRVYIGYLRKKLEDDPSKPTLLLTEPRIGYRLQG
ncbi:MAG: winged helix-turn-helix domain-containing protein [Fimbriimonadaceae bacterium]|nr:winged helix-turn-helix domain-containing protein [Fimbriimonadaceae bacterium]